MQQSLHFSRTDTKQFFRTLNKRVKIYFKENNIKRTGNWRLHLKTITMFTLFLGPYAAVMAFQPNQWVMLALTVVTGIGMAGVGMNVMHDGNHGSYSSKQWVNKMMGGSMYILAGNVYNWKVQHNVLHHTYTNIHGHDEDLDAGRVIRFSKHAKWQRFHRFQHVYSIFLYGLLTINWAFFVDFKQTRRYLDRKLAYGKLPNPFAQWSLLVVTKIFYALFWLVIPMLVLSIAWWKVLIGFVVMHYTAGLILSMVFQLAHIVEETEMPLPEKDGSIKNTWAIHQLLTTVNFSTKNRLVNWYTGGLNHQIEHHIFPNISHIHYPKIAKIVKQTAREFQLPYHEYETTRKAILSHFRYLKLMGMKPALQTV